MPVSGFTIALTTSPTPIAGAGAHGVLRVNLYNRGAGPVYLGGSSVTTSGYALSTSDPALEVTLTAYDQLFGTSTGAITINVLRYGDAT